MRRGVRWCAGVLDAEAATGLSRAERLRRTHLSHGSQPPRLGRRGGLPACIRTPHVRTPPPLRSSGAHRAAYRMHASGVAGIASQEMRPARRARSAEHGPRSARPCQRPAVASKVKIPPVGRGGRAHGCLQRSPPSLRRSSGVESTARARGTRVELFGSPSWPQAQAGERGACECLPSTTTP